MSTGAVEPLDFTQLNDQRFEVESDRDFESVVQLMNDRFGGLSLAFGLKYISEGLIRRRKRIAGEVDSMIEV